VVCTILQGKEMTPLDPPTELTNDESQEEGHEEVDVEIVTVYD